MGPGLPPDVRPGVAYQSGEPFPRPGAECPSRNPASDSVEKNGVSV